MSAAHFHIITRWQMSATLQEVVDVLEHPEDLPRWWPAVYLDVDQVNPGGEHHVGAEFDLLTKGWLPYTLRWRLRIVEVQMPHRFVVAAAGGDFAGRGVWTLQQRGDVAHVEYDWQIQALKRSLARWSFLLGPVFAWNHRWAMRRGEESMKLEIARRRANTDGERAQVPPPPQPVFRRGARA